MIADETTDDITMQQRPVLSQEDTAELLTKASKVSSWMSALKKKAQMRPFVGTSEDGMVALTIRNYRIESVNVNDTLAGALAEDVLPRIFEAHNDALDKMDAWTESQYATICSSIGIDSNIELPF